MVNGISGDSPIGVNKFSAPFTVGNTEFTADFVKGVAEMIHSPIVLSTFYNIVDSDMLRSIKGTPLEGTLKEGMFVIKSEGTLTSTTRDVREIKTNISLNDTFRAAKIIRALLPWTISEKNPAFATRTDHEHISLHVITHIGHVALQHQEELGIINDNEFYKDHLGRQRLTEGLISLYFQEGFVVMPPQPAISQAPTIEKPKSPDCDHPEAYHDGRDI